MASGIAPSSDPKQGLRRRGPTRPVLTIAALAGVQFLAVLDGLAVALALPAIGDDLRLPAGGLAWVVNCYSLALVGGLLLAGRVADVLGHRTVLLAGLVLITLGAAAAGLAPTSTALLAARVMQGLGAALCYPPGVALLADLFPAEPWRARAYAAGAAAASSGAAVGAVFGGTVTGTLGWPWVFLLTVPFGTVLIAANRLLLPAPAHRVRRSVDLPGALLGATVAVALVLALSRLEHPDPADPILLGSVAVAPAAGIAWWLWERRRADPLLPPTLLRSRTLLAGCAGIAANSALYSGTVFIGTLQLQRGLQLDATAAGLAFLPLSAASILAATFLVTPLRRRLGSSPTGVLGLALGAVALLGLAATPSTAGYGPMLAALVVIGVALACAFVSFTADAIGSTESALRGTAAGVFETCTHFAGAVSIAAFATTIASTDSYRAAYLVGAVLVVVGGATAVTLAAPARRRRP